MATQSRILAWEIPWTEEPDGLQFRRVAKSQTRLSDGAHTRHKFAVKNMTQANLSMSQKQNQGHKSTDCVANGSGCERELHWELGISRCKLVYTE